MAPNGYPQCQVDGWKGSLACPNDDAIETFGDWLDMNRTKSQLLKYGPASKAPGGKPFFLAFGAHRPHLPWNVPRKYWDMYPATEEIALPKHEAAPTDMPPIAFTYECDGKTSMNCFGVSHPIPYPAANTSLPDNVTRSFRKAYYAAVSFTDSLIGELLDTLESEGLRENTVVALIGDHGWQLGEVSCLPTFLSCNTPPHLLTFTFTFTFPPRARAPPPHISTTSGESTRTLNWGRVSLF